MENKINEIKEVISAMYFLQLTMLREIGVTQMGLSWVMPTRELSKEIKRHGKSLIEECDKLQEMIKERMDDATDA